MTRRIPIRTAAKTLGVSTSTLRRWKAGGRLRPARTDGRQRRYDLASLHRQIHFGLTTLCWTAAYAHVSSRGQIDDLDRQKQLLQLYCTTQGWAFEGSRSHEHRKLIEDMRRVEKDAQCS